MRVARGAVVRPLGLPQGGESCAPQLRGYRRAEARSAGRWRGLRAARRMLRCPSREASELRGVGGWVPGVIAQALADVATTGSEDGQEAEGELDPIWG